MPLRPEFWRTVPLAEMTNQEWEAICDGCGRCCLHKLEEETTGELFFTDVACHLLDPQTCQCSDYAARRSKVPDCIQLTVQGLETFNWLPRTCAYRLLAEGESLPQWHHLVSGDRQSIHEAGISVRGRCISEHKVENLESRIVTWRE